MLHVADPHWDGVGKVVLGSREGEIGSPDVSN